MSGVNKVILVGRLGKDPEVRNLENGASVANFTLATSESYKDKTTSEKKEITEWHNIVLWRGLAEIAAKYLHKGDMIYVEGRLRTRSWEKARILLLCLSPESRQRSRSSAFNEKKATSEAEIIADMASNNPM